MYRKLREEAGASQAQDNTETFTLQTFCSRIDTPLAASCLLLIGMSKVLLETEESFGDLPHVHLAAANANILFLGDARAERVPR